MAEAYRSTWRKSESRDEVEKQISIWNRYTTDITPTEGLAALDRLICTRTSAFAPTVGELRREVTRARYPSLLTSAEDAWGEVWTAVKAHGLNGKPEWSHPALAAAVESIGWRELCVTDIGNLGTLRAQFMRVYEAKREYCEGHESVPAAIRIEPPKPKAEVLRLDHSTQAAPAPLKIAAAEPEECSEDTFAANMAKMRQLLESKSNPEGKAVNRTPTTITPTEEQFADPNWLPDVAEAVL